MFINLFDSHLHSDNSFDGTHSITFMCEKAVEKNISGICFTDHCELLDFELDHYEMRITQSCFEANKAKVVFKGRLAVMAGVEMSDVLHDEALTDFMINKFDFDMVMASQHYDSDGTDYYDIDFSKITLEEAYRMLTDYYTYLIRVAKWNKFDTMGHLTYPLRYMVGDNKLPVDMKRYDDMFDEILKTVAENGKAIEINTSGLFGSLGDTLPSIKYVKRFRELGGEYVTIGSDAHRAEHLGRGIETGMQMLLDAGFNYFTFYKARQPIQFRII